jgi:hypothetical protein
MSDIFDLFSGRAQQRGPRKGEDVVHRLRVGLKDFYMGTTKCAIHDFFRSRFFVLLHLFWRAVDVEYATYMIVAFSAVCSPAICHIDGL